METNRTCGDCTVCCFVGEVKESIVDKPSCSVCPFLDHGCTLFGKPERPQHHCTDFLCSWLQGYGDQQHRPDKCGVMLSLNKVNGGQWIMAMDIKKNAHLTTGKQIIADVASKIDLPVIVVDYDNLKNGMGDYVIIKNSLLPRSKKIMGKLISKYTDDMNIYKLIIN